MALKLDQMAGQPWPLVYLDVEISFVSGNSQECFKLDAEERKKVHNRLWWVDRGVSHWNLFVELVCFFRLLSDNGNKSIPPVDRNERSRSGCIT